jgi:hypothetical protein
MTTVSPFARSSVFEEPRIGGREQTVGIPPFYHFGDDPSTRTGLVVIDRGNVQRSRELPRD